MTVNCPPENMVAIFRISTAFDETFRYDSAHLRKVNFDTSNIMLTLCGRNRVTAQSHTIACFSIPFSACAKYGTPEWHPLVYRITLLNGQYVEERPSLRTSSSWEQQGVFRKLKSKILFKKRLCELLINILKTENSYPSTASIITKIKNI